MSENETIQANPCPPSYIT